MAFRENDLERDLRDSEGKVTSLVAQNQKMRDDLEDIRNEMDKVSSTLGPVGTPFYHHHIVLQEVQKWKTDAYQVRSEAKALETTNTGLKAQLQVANDRIEHLNKSVNDSSIKIRDRKCTPTNPRTKPPSKEQFSDLTSSPSRRGSHRHEDDSCTEGVGSREHHEPVSHTSYLLGLW